MHILQISWVRMKGIIEMLYCTGNWVSSEVKAAYQVMWMLLSCFFFLSKFVEFSQIPFFFLLERIQFSLATSSLCCCRRLRLFSSQASLGNTSLTAVSLNDIQQRYLFFLNKIYLAPVQGSAFSLYSLGFSWSCPLFLTACIHGSDPSSPQPSTSLCTGRAACHSFHIGLLQELGSSCRFMPSLCDTYRHTEVSSQIHFLHYLPLHSHYGP